MKKNSFCEKCKGYMFSYCCNDLILSESYCGLCGDNCNNKCISCFLNNDCWHDFAYRDFINADNRVRKFAQKTGNEWGLKIRTWLEANSPIE